MASSTGIDRRTGRVRSDFDHVRQSVAVILTTPIGSRVMRREFGSEVPDLIDRPITDQVILALYAAVAIAIDRWEPRLSVTSCNVGRAGADGAIAIEITGIYHPHGHRGDFASADDAATILVDLGRRAA
jgi:hypothetical protein